MEVFRVWAIVLDYVGVVTIPLEPAVSTIFYFNDYVGTSPIIILLAILTF